MGTFCEIRPLRISNPATRGQTRPAPKGWYWSHLTPSGPFCSEQWPDLKMRFTLGRLVGATRRGSPMARAKLRDERLERLRAVRAERDAKIYARRIDGLTL